MTQDASEREKTTLEIIAEPHIQKYYQRILERANDQIELAKKAKAKGYDIETDIETKPAVDLADRTENIIGPKGIAKRYREVLLENKDNRIKAIFQIFQEIIEQKWIQIPDDQKRLEQAIRTALVLITEGVVVAPLDGVPRILISDNPDGSKYVDIYYAGPIRAAGGTATVFPLILGDFARKLMQLDRYKPTSDEIERYVEETQIYDEIISRQYKLKEEEVRKIIQGCPVCINGEPTEEREVVAHRDLKRIQTNRVRGGMCLVISEGIALKAMKILNYAKTLNLDWSWLEEVIKVTKKSGTELKISPNAKYLEGIAAGRPIFAYPSRFGGFRLRYGRTRNTGIMGKALHPATMIALDEFIAVGTQMKVERPGKAAGMFPCDSIEGPIVKLSDESVVQIKTLEEAQCLKSRIERILFLGDLLVSIGDFRKTAHPLVPIGYNEEWWQLELKKAVSEGKKANALVEAVLKKEKEPNGEEAIEISEQFNVPLHPKFIHYYIALQKQELLELAKKINSAETKSNAGKITGLLLENSLETKKLLEKICLPHKLSEDKKKIIIEEGLSQSFAKTFGFGKKLDEEELLKEESVLKILSKISGIEIRNKAGTWIGARMGRPEAAKPRKMVGNPNLLFPIGLYGGNTRSINKAIKTHDEFNEKIEVEISLFECPECKKTMESPYCNNCNVRTLPLFYCKNCATTEKSEICPRCSGKNQRHNTRPIELKEMMEKACKNLGVKMPELVKGVKGIINDKKIAEPLEKGILRSIYDLHVFRDATIRYEMLNAPLTHFKPSEIGTSIEKLVQLGYEKDIHGTPLENSGQILELFPQDIVINDESGDFFVKETKFVDDLLSRYYRVKEYYKINSRQELVGELLLGLAPHTSAAIVGRIIGFSKARVGFAHPYFHLCKRRNIDGDQDSMLLLMDALLNFSHSYLPGSRGGRMDAPLVFTIALNPTEIDDEAYEMEICDSYPLELYERSQQTISPEIDSIKRVQHVLGKKEQYSGLMYTHETSCFDAGPKKSRYLQCQTMEEKIKTQARLQTIIDAVDTKDSLELVLLSHFLPDIIGNVRAFSRQNFRCTKCNTKYRRIPLIGKCVKCGGNVILTIAQGSVRKYLEIAKEMIRKYELSDYLSQRIDLVEQEINSVFKPEKQQQKNLFEYV